MKTILIFAIPLLAFFGARADQEAIGFTIYPTAVIQEALATQGTNGLSSSILEQKAIAEGYAHAGSVVWMKTKAIQIRVDIRKRSMPSSAPNEYVYSLSFYNQDQKEAEFDLSGRIKVETTPSLANGWEQKKHAVVFKLENLKR
jgi:hypothetical protein